MPDEPMDRPPRAFNTQDLDEIKAQEPVQSGAYCGGMGELTLLTLVGGRSSCCPCDGHRAVVVLFQGDRVGYVQKFSRKGWLCKTWEGELAMVSMPGTGLRSSRLRCG